MNFILEDEANEEPTEEREETQEAPRKESNLYQRGDFQSGSLSTVPDEINNSTKEILRRSPLIGKRKEKFIRDLNQRNSPPRIHEYPNSGPQSSGEPQKTSQAWQQTSLLKFDSSVRDKNSDSRASQLSYQVSGLHQYWKKSILDSDCIANRAFTTLPSFSEQNVHQDLFKISVYNSGESNEEILDKLCPTISAPDRNPSSHESHFSKGSRIA